MQTVSWLAFSVVSPVLRTAVHFFPFGAGVSAPYPTSCALTVFGGGLSRRTVMLDGARLGQPDGVWLDDAFPEIGKKAQGFVGVGIELSTNQPRVDLSASGCIVEMVSAGGSLKYRASKMLSDTAEQAEYSPGLALWDGFNSSSLIVVNIAEQAVAPELYVPEAAVAEDAEGDQEVLRRVPLSYCEPESIVEFPLTDSVFDQPKLDDALLEGAAVGLAAEAPQGFQPLFSGSRGPEQGCYLLYRDASTHRPAGVAAL